MKVEPRRMERVAVDAILDFLADEIGYASFARDLRSHIAALEEALENSVPRSAG